MVIFEPFYENYGPDVIIAGATPRYVTLHEPEFSIDPAELTAAFSSRTKAIIVNTPHNPTGKVFSRAELELIAGLCNRFDTLAITDEIYEHIIYDGRRHISIGSLPGMQDRTITISGLSKTYSITGWRLAYAIACERLTCGDSQGARFSHRRRAPSAAGSGRVRAAATGIVLHRPAGDVSGQARDAV